MDDVIKFNGWSIPVKEQHFQQWLFDDMLTNYQEKPFNISVNFCDNFDCAIDIGANIGMMTTRYSNIFSKVIGFEPVDVNFRCLTKNTKHKDNIVIHKVGLGQTNSVVDIHNDQQYVNCGGWSINDFQNKKWQHYNKDTKLVSETILVKTLDSYNLKPDLIKIDTQSYELQVLKGAEQTIRKHKPIIQLEVEKLKTTQVLAHDITKIMKSFDYTPIKIIKKDWIFGPKENWSTLITNNKNQIIKKIDKK